MMGRRVFPNSEGRLKLAEGDYGFDSDGLFLCRPPGCNIGALDGHEITEHKDGTVTIVPSLQSDHWHGYLEHGKWRPI